MDRAIECDNRIRKELDYLVNVPNPLTFTQTLPESIIVVEPPFPNVSCEQYAIGTSGFRHSIAALYPELDSLQAGDLVLYYDENYGTVHVGRIHEDGSVISKWGNYGPVLKHPIEMVPSSYGTWVFFRRIPEEKLRGLKGKSILGMLC